MGPGGGLHGRQWLKGLGVLLLSLTLYSPCVAKKTDTEAVILLHGLARSKSSMAKLAKTLSKAGYQVLNLGYPSRTKPIEEIADQVLAPAVATCREGGAEKIHFVTHSMGGIIVRYYLAHTALPALGRVVMLSPPNGGSEVVDAFRELWIFKWLNGPAGQQIGTEADSLPLRLGAVPFELGVITGDRSINFILSCIIPGPDDGKVSVERAKVQGMDDFLVLHATHPFIMKNQEAIRQTLVFLETGRFIRNS